jgi:TonB family protein
MEKKNIFTIALSCSLVWHLVGTQAIDIVWPKKIKVRSFPQINFRGAYLQTGMVKQAETRDEQADNSDAEEEFNIVEKEKLPLTELSEKKDMDIVFDDLKVKDKLSITESMQGEFKRTVLIKPELPAYPDWAKKLGNYFEMELKFLILPDGTVATVEKTRSAGYPELDEIGIRYIRQWKFMPLPESAEQVDQWAVIKLVFNLK